MNWNIENKDLNLIRLIAENGSLTSAARRMHVSQPAASQRLANIQERIGAELFSRKDGQMRPTAIGDRLVAAAEASSLLLDETEADIKRLLEQRDGSLRIATQCYTCYRWLPFVIRDMRLTYPALSLDVVPEATEDPYAALVSERVDIAIVSNPSAEFDFAEQTLFTDELYAVMSTEHPFSKRRYLNPSNFTEQTLILYTGSKHAVTEEVLYPAGISPAQIMQVRMTEAIVELARSGQGIAVLAGWAFNDLDNKDGLVPVRITKGGFKRTWRAVINDNCSDAHVSAFVKYVRKAGEVLRSDQWRTKLQEPATMIGSKNASQRRQVG
jgi:LysR family transcriptional regulator for metE and metH